LLTIDLVRPGVRRWDPRAAVTHGSRSPTAAAAAELSNRIANVLVAAGVEPQDEVDLLLNKSRYSIPIVCSCLKACAVRVSLNGRLSAVEHGCRLAATGARALLYGAATGWAGRRDEPGT
jgi:acyl-CoA synthetase (AMP-forming)/AMP-acid ligase II